MLIAAYEHHPLVRYLRDPASSSGFSSMDWGRLLRSARHGQLSSRVAWLANQAGLMERLPEKVQFHFQSALRVAASQAISVNWEVAQIRKVLAEPTLPFVVLKGAAYITGDFNAAHGRLMSDVDIMVPRNRLLDAERALCGNGWFPTKLDNYDQRYYREWMHELPPMQHLGRGTSLDVHHTILPPTALLKPDVERLWASACAVANEDGVFLLSPADMVLHSATHLFHDGELEHGLRDLVDMDALIAQFAVQRDFFQTLVERADVLDLGRPLHYALRYCKAFLRTPVPDAVLDAVARHGSRSITVRAAMDVIVTRSIGSILEDRPAIMSRTSQFAMYVRSHYLRMPMHQLVPHLLRKQFASDKDARTA